MSHANCPDDYHPIYPEIKSKNVNPKSFRKLRLKLLSEDPRCYYCKCPLRESDSTIDHRVPRSKGGSNNEDNLVLCCSPCNNAKADKSARDFFEERRKIV